MQGTLATNLPPVRLLIYMSEIDPDAGMKREAFVVTLALAGLGLAVLLFVRNRGDETGIAAPETGQALPARDREGDSPPPAGGGFGASDNRASLPGPSESVSQGGTGVQTGAVEVLVEEELAKASVFITEAREKQIGYNPDRLSPENREKLRTFLQSSFGPAWLERIKKTVLDDPGSEESDFAMYALALLEEKSAEQMVLELLRREIELRPASAYCLRMTGGKESALWAESELASRPAPPPNREKKLLLGLLRMDLGTWSAFHFEALRTAGRESRRVECLLYMRLGASDEAIENVVEWLKLEDSFHVREACVSMLHFSRMKGGRETDLLARFLLSDPSENVRAKAAQSLASKAVKIVSMTGGHSSGMLRHRAGQKPPKYISMEYQGRMSDFAEYMGAPEPYPVASRFFDAVDALERAVMQDPSPMVRLAALESVKHIMGSMKLIAWNEEGETVEDMDGAVEPPHTPELYEKCMIRIRSLLMKASTDKDEEVREKAAKLLKK